ncbi:MAG: CHAT domain-containing tetratricopeptide repeat protein [Chloracidobacterium sp.]
MMRWLWLLVLLGHPFPGFGQTPDQPRPLTPDTRVEETLPSQGVHTYSVQLDQHDFLHVVVDQQGVDVVITILDPAGQTVLEQDSPNGRRGPEDIQFMASTGGQHRLVITALPNQGSAGRYTLRVLSLRPPTAEERATSARLTQGQAARTKGAQAEALRLSGKYDEAMKLAQAALALKEAAYGPENPFVADSIYTIAAIYYDRGDYAQAEAWYRRALAMREKTLGPEHHYVALTLNNLGLTLQKQGKFAEAEALYQRAIQIDEREIGQDSEELIPTLNNLASLYQERGQYLQAARLYQRTIAAWETLRGPDATDLAYSLNNLGALQVQQGDYVAAEGTFQRTLTIFEKALGPEHPNVAIICNNLAETFRNRGDYDRAEPLYQRGVTILEKAVGPQSPNVASLLTNLGLVAQGRKDYPTAEATFKRALSIYEGALGKGHPLYAGCLNNLAETLRRQGNLEAAEQLYHRAKAIYEKALGGRHPSVALSLSNLGWVRGARKDYPAADQLLHQALTIQTETFGPEHPDVIRTLNNLSILAQARGQAPAALEFQVQANIAREQTLARNLVAGSERQKFLYLALAKEETDRTIGLHLQALPKDSSAARAALTVILQRKGRALDAMTDAIAVLRRRGNPEEIKLLDELTALKGQISVLTQRGPGKAGPEAHRADLKALTDRADALEADISRRSAQYRARFTPVTLDRVRQAMPPDTVLIEYAVYQPFDVEARTTRSPRYAGYALKRDGQMHWADLGDAAVIDAAIQAFRQAISSPTSISAAKRTGKRLAELVVRPLDPALAGAKRLLLSPDGLLNLVPFEALSDARGNYLIEQFDLTYLTSGRDLLALPDTTDDNPNPPVVVAAPTYGQGDRLTLDGQNFPPLLQLAGTEAEARAIQTYFPNATLHLHGTATGDAVRAIHRPWFLHLATHGAFLDDITEPASADGLTRAIGLATAQPLDVAKARRENPLLRSYLFFAGANEAAPSSILTALEAAQLDLWGTRLVVLSACQTGVGTVRQGDGVYGLRRAFVLAGAQTQVMSLWAVSDQGTQALMTSFYARLRQGEARSTAIRNARLDLRRQARYRHPFYWSSFILTGDWRPL